MNADTLYDAEIKALKTISCIYEGSNSIEMASEQIQYALPQPCDLGLGESKAMTHSPDGPTQEEIQRYIRELKQVPEPNCGRIQELREKIKNKTLVTKEAVEEAAMRLAARFLGKER